MSQWVNGMSQRLKWYFRSDAVFNLSKRGLSESEIGVLEKGLAPIQEKVNEPYFQEFCWRMRIK